MSNQVLLFFILAFAFILPPSGNAYQPWSEDVFIHIEKEYGGNAEKRMRFYHTLIIDNQGLSDMDKLTLVNDTLNRLPWIADSAHWKEKDYWATPIETIATFGGDCEDIALVKWAVLRHLGIGGDHLRLAYVEIKETGENHMVLLYIENPEQPVKKQKSLVLDNYESRIIPGKERTDLLGIYVTDGKGTLILIDSAERTIKGVYTGRKMKKIDELKEKIEESRSLYTELNDGRPLLPE